MQGSKSSMTLCHHHIVSTLLDNRMKQQSGEQKERVPAYCVHPTREAAHTEKRSQTCFPMGASDSTSHMHLRDLLSPPTDGYSP
jgi:hypothetical protein